MPLFRLASAKVGQGFETAKPFIDIFSKNLHFCYIEGGLEGSVGKLKALESENGAKGAFGWAAFLQEESLASDFLSLGLKIRSQGLKNQSLR